jgi:hypothetical protein
MKEEIHGYDMEGAMLDLSFNVNILPNTLWEVIGKLKLVFSPI